MLPNNGYRRSLGNYCVDALWEAVGCRTVARDVAYNLIYLGRRARSTYLLCMAASLFMDTHGVRIPNVLLFLLLTQDISLYHHLF